MLISFYDCLCKTEPQKLQVTMSKLPLYSWASPSFVRLEGTIQNQGSWENAS